MNNKISIYSNLKHHELIDIINRKYYDDNIFLSLTFFDDFGQYFNCNYHDFIFYIENYEIYSPIDIVDNFFEYKKINLFNHPNH